MSLWAKTAWVDFPTNREMNRRQDWESWFFCSPGKQPISIFAHSD
jgi:hypothetical protein